MIINKNNLIGLIFPSARFFNQPKKSDVKNYIALILF